jgi:hypothetical protein
MGSDEAEFAYFGPIQNRGLHSYETTLPYFCPVYNGTMTYSDMRTDNGFISLICVQNGIVLNVTTFA